MKTISIHDLEKEILNQTPIIDVRAAIEFKTGSIPGSINIPILNDEERHLVGLCYKQKGQQAAIVLGHEIVSGENLELKRQTWKKVFDANPQTIVTCFRGGLRSQSTQKFLKEIGIEAVRLEKGYKSARQFFIETNQKSAVESKFLIISGTTGSGKTHLLNEISGQRLIVNLEEIANHRGSAFGAMSLPQPAQADFENRIAVQMMKCHHQAQNSSWGLHGNQILIEDESRLIGSCHIPEPYFLKMRQSDVVLIEEPIESRVELIFADYISDLINQNTEIELALALFAKYKNSVLKIQKKLGGLRSQELLQDLNQCESDFLNNKAILKNKIWIEKILVWYYDSMYLGSLRQRNPEVIFKGTRSQVKNFLISMRA